MAVDAVWVVLTVVFAAALLRTTVGFGDALFAMPLLSFVIDVKLAAPLIASVSATLSVAVLLRDCRQIHIRSAWWLVLFSLLGIPIGLAYLTQIDERVVKRSTPADLADRRRKTRPSGLLPVRKRGLTPYILWKER